MPTEEEVHRAQQANRLVNHEPVLVEALTNMRISALNELATIKHSEKERFDTLQAKVACTEELLAELQGFILSGQPTTQPEESTAAH